MPPEWHEQARQLQAQGLSIREIAARVGKARSAVGEALHPDTRCRCGARRTRRAERCADCYQAERHAAHEEYLERVAQMYESGMPLREIVQALGWGEGSAIPVITELAERGRITLRHASKKRELVEERDRIIAARHAEGATSREIAAEVGMVVGSVNNALKWIKRGENGVRARDRAA